MVELFCMVVVALEAIVFSTNKDKHTGNPDDYGGNGASYYPELEIGNE